MGQVMAREISRSQTKQQLLTFIARKYWKFYRDCNGYVSENSKIVQLKDHGSADKMFNSGNGEICAAQRYMGDTIKTIGTNLPYRLFPNYKCR